MDKGRVDPGKLYDQRVAVARVADQFPRVFDAAGRDFRQIDDLDLIPKSAQLLHFRVQIRIIVAVSYTHLGIAQAIMEDPSLLILDEPMNGLDDTGVLEARRLLAEMKEKGKTIILASHDRQDIDTLCDAVYEMNAGKMTRVR